MGNDISNMFSRFWGGKVYAPIFTYQEFPNTQVIFRKIFKNKNF